MKQLFKFFAALALLCPFITVCGQPRSAATTPGRQAFDRPWQVTSYAAETGLSAQRVFDIAFDPDGTTWLATGDGLRRFDGYEWKRFGTNDGLPSSFIRSVLVTKAGDLWVGSDAGAGVFDPRNGKYDPRGSRENLANRNVREIREDADGALWFSCDQWPERTEKKGGLSRFKDGMWTTFTRKDGLSMDYVIGSFQATDGRKFALTPRGWTQWVEGRWREPINPGFQVEPCVLHMAEMPDGTLFAQGEFQLLRLRSGVWNTVGDSTQIIGRTDDGELIGVEQNATKGLIWFSVWDGDAFIKMSASVPSPPGERLYAVRQAPDGAIWCVGTGVVVRWDYRTGSQWTLFPDLPPAGFADARGRTWFHSDNEVWLGETGSVRKLDLERLVSVTKDGTALGRRNSDGKLGTTDALDPARFTPVESRVVSLKEAMADINGGFWLVGDDAQGEARAERVLRGEVNAIATERFKARHIAAADPDPGGGFWSVLQPRERMANEIVHVSDAGVRWYVQTNAAPITYPTMTSGAGRFWLSGYPGLYEAATPSGPWTQVSEFPDTGFHAPLATSEEFLVRFTGGRSGRSGCALFTRENGWQIAYGDFIDTRRSFGGQPRLILAGDRLCIRHEAGSLSLDSILLPPDMQLSGAVAAADGSYWLNTSDGVLHYRPRRSPPETRIASALLEIRSGSELPIQFYGRRRFAQTTTGTGFTFSWRADSNAWTPFAPQPAAALRLPDLAPGRHTIEVRARNADAVVDPTPAALVFTVLPVPLQERPWFRPALVLLAATIGVLVWFGVARTRAMTASNIALRHEVAVRRRTEADLQAARSLLEERVAERTSELTRTNESLQHEIEERHHAEEDRRRLEDQLRQSQKMEAIGTLAGGIAHDFNNILAVIIPSTQLAIDQARANSELSDHLHHILTASARAKNLVQQILAFSRQRQQERRVLHLGPIIEETVRLLRAALPSMVEIGCSIDPGAPPVLADTTQIHQLLMNLGTNAEHALRGKPGKLSISLDRVDLDETAVRAIPDLRPGRHVLIRTTDTGCGIPKETLDRIYDPFFTTKGPGQGTGLGLAVVHGIVKTHEGAIVVRSEVGRGTTFEIYLPAAAAVAPPPAPPAESRPMGSGERVLVVDDEPAILKVLTVVLQRAGYQVVAVGDSNEARNRLVADPDSFDLVFSDLTMPGITGTDLAREALALRPKMPVIIATGFGGDALAKMSATPNIVRVLDKPLDYSAIVRAVHEALSMSTDSPRSV